MTPPRRTPLKLGPSRRTPGSILGELKDRLRLKAPELANRGPEDPAWVLLEVLAETLLEIEDRIDLMEERVFPRVLESLGDEPRWGAGASVALVFHGSPPAEVPTRIPGGTTVSAPRRDGEDRVSFETLADGWTGSARLLRAVTCAGNSTAEIFPHPESGWDGEPVPLFAKREVIFRHLYLGDKVLGALRENAGSLLLEWPGSPSVLWEGSWEHSVRGGWRRVHVELEETQVGSKKCVLLRVRGPLPDLAEEDVDSTRLPWLRLSLEGGRRTTLSQPRWIAAEPRSASIDFPRHVARILSFGGERWEDHSLTAQKIVPVESPEAWDPALYLGWDRPMAASVFLSILGRPAPPGWMNASGRGPPELVWEHSAGRGFRPLAVADGTLGFTTSGSISWALPGEWSPQEHFGERLHWVRARWISGAYRNAPVLRALIPHGVHARQQTTLENHWVEVALDPLGRGPLHFPGSGGAPERFHWIDVQKDGTWNRLAWRRSSVSTEAPTAPATEEERVAGCFKAFRSLHDGFLLDLGVQWAGATGVRIPRLVRSLGVRGNVAAGALTILEGTIPGVVGVSQPIAAEGGRDVEDPDAFRRRVRAEWKTSGRAVTAEDFRWLAMGLDPEIARVETLADPGSPWRIRVCVVPEEPCHPGRFSPARLEWISEMLEARAPVGTVVEALEPVYLPVEVRVKSSDGLLVWPEPFRRLIEETLRGLFHPLRGGPDHKGFPAGAWPGSEALASSLARRLSEVDTQAPGVGVNRLSFELLVTGGAMRPPGVVSETLFLSAPLVIPCLERVVLDGPERF